MPHKFNTIRILERLGAAKEAELQAVGEVLNVLELHDEADYSQVRLATLLAASARGSILAPRDEASADPVLETLLQIAVTLDPDRLDQLLFFAESLADEAR